MSLSKVNDQYLMRRNNAMKYNPYTEVNRAKEVNPYAESEREITEEERKVLTYPRYIRKNFIVRDKKVGIKEKFIHYPKITKEVSPEYYTDIKRIRKQRSGIKWFDVKLTTKHNIGHKFYKNKQYAKTEEKSQ